MKLQRLCVAAIGGVIAAGFGMLVACPDSMASLQTGVGLVTHAHTLVLVRFSCLLSVNLVLYEAFNVGARF